MKVFAVVGGRELDEWKKPQHPFYRSEVEITEFAPGADLKQRLISSGLPDFLVIEASLLGRHPDEFIWDLHEIKAWERVQIIILCETAEEAATCRHAGTKVFAMPVSPLQYEELAKTKGAMTSRRYPRKVVNAPCALVSMGKRIDCRIHDLSICGCRIEYEGQLQVGAMIHVAFAVKIGPKSFVIKSTAKVVRSIPRGYGLSFTTMEQQDRAVLNSFIRG